MKHRNSILHELNKIEGLTNQLNFIVNQQQPIEEYKAAGSYDKMMVADIAISLSRKKEDKVNGTGRVHIMKNSFSPMTISKTEMS